MNVRLLDGRKLAENILGQARRHAALTRGRRGRAPGLAIVSAAGSSAQSYLKATVRACASVGIEATIHKLSSGPRAKTMGLLADIAEEDDVDAVLVETPYPHGLTAADIATVVPNEKDVEGLSAQTYGRLFLAKNWAEASRQIGPCTAFALARLALAAKVPLAGRRAIVIGRSTTVGRPTAHLLSTLDMTVTLAHSRTQDLARLCREADVLVAAAGAPGLVKSNWIKPGALVLDAGLHLKAGNLIGDVSPAAAKRAGVLTPVPGGVGPVTTAVMVLQVARLADQR